MYSCTRSSGNPLIKKPGLFVYSVPKPHNYFSASCVGSRILVLGIKLTDWILTLAREKAHGKRGTLRGRDEGLASERRAREERKHRERRQNKSWSTQRVNPAGSELRARLATGRLVVSPQIRPRGRLCPAMGAYAYT